MLPHTIVNMQGTNLPYKNIKQNLQHHGSFILHADESELVKFQTAMRHELSSQTHERPSFVGSNVLLDNYKNGSTSIVKLLLMTLQNHLPPFFKNRGNITFGTSIYLKITFLMIFLSFR